jgi:hypothetical protein
VLLGNRLTVVYMSDGRATARLKLGLLVVSWRRRWAAVKQSQEMSCRRVVSNLFWNNLRNYLFWQLIDQPLSVGQGSDLVERKGVVEIAGHIPLIVREESECEANLTFARNLLPLSRL